MQRSQNRAKTISFVAAIINLKILFFEEFKTHILIRTRYLKSVSSYSERAL